MAIKAFLIYLYSIAICAGLTLWCVQPAQAQTQTIGSACTSSGAPVNNILLNSRYTDLVCDGTTWQERESAVTGSSTTAAKSLLQIGYDSGTCTTAKQGRISYNATTDTLCYCSGSAWTKWGGSGVTC